MKISKRRKKWKKIFEWLENRSEFGMKNAHVLVARKKAIEKNGNHNVLDI